MVSFITFSGSLFITLSARSLLHYRGGCLLHYRLNLLHYREVLHHRLIFITLSGSITLSGVYYIIGCNTRIKTKTGSRVFSISGPALWNALPGPIRNAKTMLPFQK